jgi:apolipoprotein N-acyltransferase
MNKKQLFLLPLCSAILLAMTRLPLSFDMLVFVAFVPLFYFLDFVKILTKKELCIGGSIFAIVYSVISVHWISLVTFGGFLGILLIFSVVYSLLLLHTDYFAKKNIFNPQWNFIVVWLINELLWNFTEFRFPWFNIVYGLKNTLPLLQLLEYTGPFVMSFMIMGVNYLFYRVICSAKNENTDNSPSIKLGWNQKFIVSLSIPILIIVSWYVYGVFRMNYVQKNTTEWAFKVALVQGNIEQDIKWEEAMLDETFEIYEQMTREIRSTQNPDLIVYPEAALPEHLLEKGWYQNRIVSLVAELHTPIFTGFPHYEFHDKYRGQDSPFLYYNAAMLFTPNIPVAEKKPYYKKLLVPFGERTPLLNVIPALWKIQMGQANFETGEDMVIYNVRRKKRGQDDFKPIKSFSPSICFEMAFPIYFQQTLREHNPDFWVNITNDAWFYRSIGTHQHAMMSVFRTIETRKPVFRVANTGYSFYTTPDGRIHEKTELFDRTTVTGHLHTFRDKPFVNLFASKCLLLLLSVYVFTQAGWIIVKKIKN